nr:single-stranded DNA-binding protein [Cytobacillus firmus]
MNRSFTNQKGEREADFFQCQIWRNPAENVANFLKNSSLAGVDWRIQTRSFEGQDGKRVYITEVRADSVQFLEPKKDANSSNREEENYNRGNRNDNPFPDNDYPGISDDDLPF